MHADFIPREGIGDILDDELDPGTASEICVKNKATHVGRRKINNASRQLGFDTMASFGITNNLELFGKRRLSDNIEFRITSWANDTQLVKKHGVTAFGTMIYTPNASATILCGRDMYQNWIVTWEANDLALTAKCKTNDGLLLRFCSQKDGVLTCTPSDEQWSAICQMPVESDGYPDIVRHNGVARYAIAREEYQRAWEAIRFHECSCHAGFECLREAISGNCLRDTVARSRDIDLVGIATDWGGCLACQMGKSKDTSRVKRQNGVFNDGRPQRDYPEEDKLTATSTLGLDLFYVEQRAYLIAVSKAFAYVHVVPIERREKHCVANAIKAVIMDYKANHVNIMELYRDQLEEIIEQDRRRQRKRSLIIGEPVSVLESDNEGAFIAASVELLPSMGIKSVFVPAGEHVGYVERQIQTIKERYAACCCTLNWKLTGSLQNALINNIVNWMNFLPCKKVPQSAWLKLTKRSLSYKALTITKFGDPVVAHRPDVSINDGTAKGELGLSLGPNPNNPGSIYFFSLHSHQIKVRKRFVLAAPISLLDYGFERNANYLPQNSLHRGYAEYLSTRPNVGEGGNDLEGPGMVAPPYGSMLTEPDHPDGVPEIVTDDRVYPTQPPHRDVPDDDGWDVYNEDDGEDISVNKQRRIFDHAEQITDVNVAAEPVELSDVVVPIEPTVVPKEDLKDDVQSSSCKLERRIQPSRKAKQEHRVVTIRKSEGFRQDRQQSVTRIAKAIEKLSIPVMDKSVVGREPRESMVSKPRARRSTKS